MNKTMMACGCAANAVCDGKPSCAIHDCLTPVATPELTGRAAKCAYGCGSMRPSALDLPFFEYRGAGSPWAVEGCQTCGILEGAHHPINRFTGLEGITTHPFVARGPADMDSYYCGCRGWD